MNKTQQLERHTRLDLVSALIILKQIISLIVFIVFNHHTKF